MDTILYGKFKKVKQTILETAGSIFKSNSIPKNISPIDTTNEGNDSSIVLVGQPPLFSNPTPTPRHIYNEPKIRKFIRSEFQIASDINFNDIVEHKTTPSYIHTCNPVNLSSNTKYYWRYRYVYEGILTSSPVPDRFASTSNWSEPTSFTTANVIDTMIIDNIGIPLGGGYFAGIIDTTSSGGLRYALIVAPKAQGESSSTLKWKTTNTSTSGTDSLWDGWTNSNNMNNSDHPAAYYCRNLSINGYDDWYLPAVDELELLYRHFKPNTSANTSSFYSPYSPKTSGYNPSSDPNGSSYTSSNPAQTTISAFLNEEIFIASNHWSSSENDSIYSVYQVFAGGNQSSRVHKHNSNYVRAVRRLIL